MKFSLHPTLPAPTEQQEEQLVEALAGFPLELIGRREGDKAYISPAQIKMFARCPEQFRRRYVRGEKEPPSGSLVWGRADHSAVEDNFKQKIVTKRDLKTGDVQIGFAAALDREVEEAGGAREVIWDEKDRNMTIGDAKKRWADVKDKGTRLVGAYHDEVASTIDPVAVEERFELDLKEQGVPVPVVGAIDLVGMMPVTPAPEPGKIGERLIDRKTKAQNRMNGEWLIQGRIYQLHRPVTIDWQLSLRPARNVKNWTPRVVHGKYLYEPVPPVVVIAQIRRAMAGIANCYSLYGPDQPWPDALGSTWACDYCGWGPKAKDDCPWWNEERWNR